MEAIVGAVMNPDEKELAKFRMVDVRFDCLVRMYDSGIRVTEGGFFGRNELPPQWFKSELKLTLEFIRYTDPLHIGLAIKQSLQKLDEHISQYENRR